MRSIIKSTITAAAILAVTVCTARPPKLVVNIIVSSMRADDLDRYGNGFGEGGFRRLMSGVNFTGASYGYMQTTTPVSLATLTTGAQPSTHGVVGEAWYDYVDNRRVELATDRTVTGFGYPNSYDGRFSPANLLAPTIGDALCDARRESRVATVALEPASAIVAGGRHGVAYWMEPSRTMWSSSTYYMLSLPDWVEDFNRRQPGTSFTTLTWELFNAPSVYVNRRLAVVSMQRERRGGQALTTIGISGTVQPESAYDRLRYTPAGNDAVLEFARRVLTNHSLGQDDAPDMLNIVLDTPRFVTECYGPESIEAEDMFYRLDSALSDFLNFLYSRVRSEDVLVVLTSDHGTSPSYDASPTPVERVNMMQSEVIVNGFLNARHGQGNWVTAISDRSIWLNRDLIYNRGLNLAEIQEEVASFVMQFRGIAHALSSSALRSGSFADGYGRKMQNGFYPRRSGDVIFNLMPGRTEERSDRRSESGSMYGYDTRVPLLFSGWRVPSRRVTTPVDMTSVAATIASVLGITPPAASEGLALRDVGGEK